MPSNLWPNSATRKMYGQAGKALDHQQKSFSETLSRHMRDQKVMTQKEIEAIKAKVAAYQSLPWYKKLWLALKELFGHKTEILQG